MWTAAGCHLRGEVGLLAHLKHPVRHDLAVVDGEAALDLRHVVRHLEGVVALGHQQVGEHAVAQQHRVRLGPHEHRPRPPVHLLGPLHDF